MNRSGSLRNEDLISELPDDLLLQILSLIPTHDVVATSVLSKRWRSLCKKIPNLEFCYLLGNGLERFSDDVCRFLLSHQAPVLQSLHLEMDYENDFDEYIGLLLGVAFGLHVRELGHKVNNDVPYRFPISLCGALETLKLGPGVLLDVRDPVCLKALRTLSLNDVFSDDGSVVNLLSGCSVLENLEVVMRSHYCGKTFTIDVSSLQRLTLTSENEDSERFTDYVINAPSLKHLEIHGLREHDSSCLIENMPDLVEASIDLCSFRIYENVHGSLTSVKRLALWLLSPFNLTKFPTHRIFNQLVYMKLHACEPEWWDLFMLMLDRSPNLQVLKLSTYWVRDEEHGDYKRWTQPKYVPECLLNRLEKLVWDTYEGEVEDEKGVAQYILRNACRLKTATFSRINNYPEKNLESFKELASVVRASNSCQLVFEEFDRTSCKRITLPGL